MTSTSHLQTQPESYSSIEECKKFKKNIPSNSRYKNFKQTHFTAGDIDQFEEYRDMTNGQLSIPEINLDSNKFKNTDLSSTINWNKYKNLNATSVDNTFNYMFHKFKKGVFVKIKNNELAVFLPFSKNNFTNEWADKIKIDPIHGDIYKFEEYINKLGGKHFKPSINRFTDSWYSNNCLVRYEFPIHEGDTNVSNMSDMLKQLCSNRTLPDIEFFVNRRDFPVIKRDDTEAYDHLFGDNQPLISHKYDQYSPILSMVTTKDHSDIPIPTGDDWSRIASKESKYFTHSCNAFPQIEDFKVEWENKKPTAVFRGASTGCGVTIDTNIRLKLAYISANTPPDKDGLLLDAGISKWQLRPRKLKTEKYLQTINVPEMNKKGIKLASFLTPIQQSEYKYLVNVDGHVSAFRLSLEMSMGCCILLAESKYKLWFTDMIKPMIHYVPIKSDLSDLIDQIKWCRSHDSECKKIANNSRKFYLRYLQKDGVLDYLQKLIIDLKNQSGLYLYNTETPLQTLISIENNLDLDYPLTNKTIKDIGSIPKQARSFGVLKGLQWIVNMINKTSSFEKVATKNSESPIFANKNSIVSKYTLADFMFVVKSTNDRFKKMENIHEAYIGTNGINDIIKYIPNFAYVFGKYDGDNTSNVIMEHINGKTLDKWIESDKFNMTDFIFICIQLAFALEVAQRQCAFVHWDLTPWNIIIQELPSKISFDYVIDSNNVYRVHTNIIPVIIDYGKSHIIYKNKHHGFINMFKVSTIQDIISLLLTSLNSITQLKNITTNDVKDVITLANFLSNTGYRKKLFRQTGAKGVSDVQYFVIRAKKYTEMISSNKHELENKTPLDFIKYISKNFKHTFAYEKIDYPEFRINKGNPTQVFNYILSSNKDEKIKSFTDVFDKYIKCKFDLPDNLFFSYYAIQTLEYNMSSMYGLMEKYIKRINDPTVIKYKKIIENINDNFKKQIQTQSHEKIDYYIGDKFKKLNTPNYDQQTFLTPDIILNILNSRDHIYNKEECDVSDYKNMIELVFLNKGIFKLSDKDKEYYKDNFNELLNTNSVNLKTNIANILTLSSMSKLIYSKNVNYLEKSNTTFLSKYLSTYKKINILE